MKPILASIVTGLSLGMLAASPAWAQSAGSPVGSVGVASVADIGDVNIFAGVRLWANEWNMGTVSNALVGNPSNPSSLMIRQQQASSNSDMKFVPMPVIGARYGNFLGSVTYFIPTSYGSKDFDGSVERREVDVNLGYYVLPSLLVSLVYKYATTDRVVGLPDTIGSKQKIQGLLLGLSGTAPLGDKLSLYGSFAYGLARQDSESKDARGEDQYSSTYAIADVGLSYRLMEGSSGSFLKSVNGSLGYRTQIYTTKDIGFGTFAANNLTIPISTTTQDIRSTTNGFVLAIIGAF